MASALEIAEDQIVTAYHEGGGKPVFSEYWLRSNIERALLILILISGMSSPASAPPIPLYDFVVDGETVRERQDFTTCSILTGFYGRLGVESFCLQEKR